MTIFVGSGSRLSRTPQVGGTESVRYMAYSPQGLSGSAPEHWKQDLQSPNKSGVLVTIDRGRPAVEWFGDKRATNVYFFDGGEVSASPASKIPGVAKGSHLIVPADGDAEHQLNEFLKLTGGFTADVKSSLIEAICEPDLRHRLARTERILAGLERLEEQAGIGHEPASSSPSIASIARLWPYAAAIAGVAVIAFVALQFFGESGSWREDPYPEQVAQGINTVIERIEMRRGSQAADLIVQTWRGEQPKASAETRITSVIPATLFWAAGGRTLNAGEEAQRAILDDENLQALLLDAACRVPAADGEPPVDGVLKLDDRALPLWLGRCPDEAASQQTLVSGLTRLLDKWPVRNRNSEPEEVQPPVPDATVTTGQPPTTPPTEEVAGAAKISRIVRAEVPLNEAFTLDIYGEGFSPKSIVLVGKSQKVAKFIDAKHITVPVAATDTARAGPVDIVVLTPDKKPSNTVVLTVK